MNNPPGTVPRADDNHSASSISLVLGSGGARGYAHIGAIEELEAQGFAIRSISGSSMGALIGGIYAAGKLDAYRDWVRVLQRLDVLRLLDWTLSGGGFIKGERIIDVLKHLIGEVNIEDLPIPYTAVAVDLDAQREVWFSQGPLFDAIRASIAIPSVFRPYLYQGRLFVDGGLLNPLPVSPTLRDLTDATIAVDVNAPAEPLYVSSKKDASGMHGEDQGSTGRASPEMLPGGAKSAAPDGERAGYRRRFGALVLSVPGKRETRAAAPSYSALELFARSLDCVQETITRLKVAAQPPDLLIAIPRNVCAVYEFHRADELIEIGRQRTREALARWSPPRTSRARDPRAR